ncbi:MAG: hypothetical protein JWL73_354 [Actinomycetia bacterium]|nr:hypothetical protein [Actinomycetes bacterium]
MVKVQGYAPPRPRAEIALAAGAVAAVLVFTVLEVWLLEPNGLARRQPRAYMFWHGVALVFVGCTYFLHRRRTPYTARRFLAGLPLAALAVAALAYALNDNDTDSNWVRGSFTAAAGFVMLWALVEALVVLRRRIPDDPPDAVVAGWSAGLTLVLAVVVWFAVPGGIVRTIASVPSTPVVTPTTTAPGSGATTGGATTTAPPVSTTTAGASTTG